MKEGPEALVGGPPLSLSEGPALSAFRLRPLGRDATCAFLEDVPSPLTLALGVRFTRLPSKGVSAAAGPTVVLPAWGLPSRGGWEEAAGRRNGGCALGPCCLASTETHSASLTQHWEFIKAVHICSHSLPQFSRQLELK